MPLVRPFFTYYGKVQRNTVDGTGITVWIVTVGNEQEKVGYSWRHPSHHYDYYADYKFVQKYEHELPIGDVLKWESRRELDIWINKQIYSSHQIYDGIQTVWFSRVLEDHSIFLGSEFLANGHKDLVQMESGDYWVLLGSGWRVFPIRVVNNKIGKGWVEFCQAHKLRLGRRLLFGAERKWVFDVVILDEQYNRIEYNWVSVDNELDIGSETDGLDTSVLPCAWVPSVLLGDDYVEQFACVWTP